MIKYAVLVSYLGTEFCGWQKQKHPVSLKQGIGDELGRLSELGEVGGSKKEGRSDQLSRPTRSNQSESGTQVKTGVQFKTSVQARIEEALLQMTGEIVSVVGSGRTDSGVHALGQVAHFILKNKVWDPKILLRGLNGLLRPSIQILSACQVPIEFHSQKSAQKKQYSYYFQQGPCAIPHLEPMSWWIQKELNLDAMQKGISILVGEHDFKAFQGSGAKPGPTVRRILEAEITLQTIPFPSFGEGFSSHFQTNQSTGLVRVRIVGTGFLKQMVRGIAGTLLQVGEGRRPHACFQDLLDTRNRSDVGPTAPARALWLEQVWYSKDFGLPWLSR